MPGNALRTDAHRVCSKWGVSNDLVYRPERAGGRLAVMPSPRFAPPGPAIGLARGARPAWRCASPSSR